MELVDTRDLKSLDRNIVPVQVRPRAPSKKLEYMKINNQENTSSIYDFDLLEMLSFFYERKKIIISFTGIGLALSIIYALTLKNIYTSEALVSVYDQGESDTNISSIFQQASQLAGFAGISLPSSGSNKSDYLVEVLQSKEFVKHISTLEGVKENIIAAEKYENNSKTIIYDNSLYDVNSSSWIREPTKIRGVIPSYIELDEVLRKKLKILKDPDTNFIRIKFEHISPIYAAEFLETIIKECDDNLRIMDMQRSETFLEYLNNMLSKTSDQELRSTINNLIKNQIEIQMLGSVKEYYFLNIIDPPHIPEKKSYPNRASICIIGLILSFMISIIYILFRDILFLKRKS